RLGTVTVLTLKLIDVKAGSVVVRARRTATNDAELPGAIDALAADLVAGLDAAKAPTNTITDTPRSPTAKADGETTRFVGKVAIGLGGVLLLAGVGLGLKVRSDASNMKATPRPAADGAKLVDSINSRGRTGDMLSIGGGALSAVGVGILVV